MIKSIDVTNIVTRCEIHDSDDSEQTVAIASLVVGVTDPLIDADGDPEIIRLPACPLDPGHTEFLFRTRENPKVFAGVVNGLHRALVTAAQFSDADVQAILEAEAEEDKPIHFYELTADPILVLRGIDREWSDDLAALIAIHGLTEAKQRARMGAVFTDQSDGNIGAFAASLFPSDDASRIEMANFLIERKGLHFP